MTMVIALVAGLMTGVVIGLMLWVGVGVKRRAEYRARHML